MDEALCFGWIDGIRRSIDDESYCNRFTPRKAKSTWSAINIKKVEELTKMGLMKPEGQAAFNKRDEANSKTYSYENEAVKLDRKYEKKLKGNKKAFTFFSNQALSYQKATTRWIMSAKQETTQLSRLETLIRDSEAGQLINPMRYGRKIGERNPNPNDNITTPL